jgi:hypothetical protein
MQRARGRFVSGLIRMKSKSQRLRWTDVRRRQVYEEDTQHGELEKYNQRGRHKGTVDPETGEIIKAPVRGRRIDM